MRKIAPRVITRTRTIYRDKTDYKGIIYTIFAIVVAYLVVTNWTEIMKSGLLFYIFAAVTAYYVIALGIGLFFVIIFGYIALRGR